MWRSGLTHWTANLEGKPNRLFESGHQLLEDYLYIDENLKDVAGIYGLFSKQGECLYVGQSKCLYTRLRKHLSNLNSHHTNVLKSFQEWYDFNGEDSLQYKVLQVTTESTLLNSLEIDWFNTLSPKFFGKKPSINEKWEHSLETKAKIKESVESRLVSRLCIMCNTTFLGLTSDICSVRCRYYKSKGLTKGTVVDDEKVMKTLLEGSYLLEGKYHKNRYREITEDTLRELYLKEMKSCRAIAKELGYSEPTVRKYLRLYGIEVRTREDQYKISTSTPD